ncbi:MAG: beta-(1,2)-glucan production associated transrane protein [Myxococcales bacterium]|nr:beta-(1,2)-glucan production associated transrane protein [Myxococcales bacterium]
MRAELFSVSQLERHARTIAGWHELSSTPSREDSLLARLGDNEGALADAYALITDAVQRGRQITPAAEWFIDNYHLIEEQIRTARLHLPREYNRELPRLTNAPTPGTPRVYHIALELISHAHGRVDTEGLRAFVASYQEIQPLRLGELWAIPIMLRLALLENLRRVVMAVTAGRRDREAAAEWVGKMLTVATTNPTDVVLVLADLIDANPPLTNAFVAELATRLQAQGSTLAFPMSWLEQRLAESSQTVEHVFEIATQSQAADQVSIGNSIGSLRFLGATDWRDFVESMSVVERTLRDDPAYPAMDFATRDRYRHVIEATARRSSISEDDVARAAIRLTSGRADRTAHVGYFLIDKGRRALERTVNMRRSVAQAVRGATGTSRQPIYAAALILVTAIGTLGLARLGPLEPNLAWCALLAICASELAVALVHLVATLMVTPQILPRLDFSSGIPAAHRTLVAIPAMLTDAAEIDELVEELEVRFLANRDPNLAFALVTDFRDAATEITDADTALLRRAVTAIEALGAKYPDHGGLFLLHRARRWSPREKVWMGWERKRGKLEELNAALRGESGLFATIVGSVAQLADIKYVIALDADTGLPRDSARVLAGTLAHPLNRPCYDEARGRVTDGYGILQPRVGVSMASISRSRFARLFGGRAGIDPYTRAVSDVYQDVFDEGSFIGKGIYDVDAVRRAIGNRLPDNRVLSHDLLEGAYVRSGLVSDVLLVEDFPSTHAADISRRHRWIRGDWQIMAWLLRRVPGRDARIANPISKLSQWKVLDNLRRSIMPIAFGTLLALGWTQGAAWFATLTVFAIALVPSIAVAISSLARRPVDLSRSAHARDVLEGFGQQLAREGFWLGCLPFDAMRSLDAIGRSVLRMLVTRRKLLEWRTARDVQRTAHVSLRGSFAAMWIGPALAITTAVRLELDIVLAAAPFLVLWTISPVWSWWASQPIDPAHPQLDGAERTFLHTIARRTWRFFETYVGAEDNFLPPDNVQEDPPRGVAHRTSPTNIGLSLLSSLAAYDFGYIAAGDLVARTTRTFATLDRMQRYRNHLYNWYDTTTLEPLRPMYVSTVDNGNLAGHMRTLAAGLDELDHRATRPALSGLAETLDVLAEITTTWPEIVREVARLDAELTSVPTTTTDLHALLERLTTRSAELVRLVDSHGVAEATWWARSFEAHCKQMLDELVYMAPWIELPRAADPATRALLDGPLTLAETARLDLTVHGGDAPHLRSAVAGAAQRAIERMAELRALALRCREFSDLDFELLYDRSRHLLSIGYNVSDRRLDGSYYDLLASEARLASFIAIADGKLPQEHWFSLGRQLTTTHGRPALLSWSGSMFEYLMPLLVMPTYDGTLLDETNRAIVERQIAFGRERGVPWGVSESGYNTTDAQLNYQYRAFGVPGLGFKRGLADDCVIAPYATALALMIAPDKACANLRKLAGLDMLGPYGFYEALDYTSERVPSGKDHVVVRSFMAHHQGMTLLALAYVLLGRPMQRRFAAAPSFRATELLLQERIPRAPAIFPHPAEVSTTAATATANEDDLRVFTTPNTLAPEVHLLSNGHYHVAITNAGGGYSRWRDLAVTRWHEDPTRDCWGTFGYLRDVTPGTDASVEPWSIAYQPTLASGTSYEAIFSQGRAEFRRVDREIDTHVEISISPEDDIELRRISLTNRGRTVRTIELTSFAEVVITQPAADAAHPAFSNLFVQTEILRAQQAIVCTRRPRSGSERPPWMIHLTTVHGTAAGETSYETSRPAFIGRGRTVIDPIAMHCPALTGTEGSVLDPIVAIRNRLVLQPDECARIHVVTGMSETRVGALGLIEKYRDRHAADRVFELSWTHSQVVQRRLEATNADTQLYERLASNVLYANPTLRAPSSLIARNRGGQSALWAYGISGDLPIVLVRIADVAHIDLVRQLVKAHGYWRLKGLSADLVIWNEDPSGYRQVLHDEIMSVIAAVSDANVIDKPGGIFVRRTEQLSEDDKVLMQTVSRLIVADTAGTLAEQLERKPRADLPPPLFANRTTPARGIKITHAEQRAVPTDRPDLVDFNGLGGFTPDGREYVITTTPDQRTPAPWVNVIANPWFGTIVSESGSSYTWCENAHGYRLTPWSNDAVSDLSGEAFYLRDEEDGHVWSPTPLPIAAAAPYTSRHGFGYSVFEVTEGGISSELRTYVATDAPIKFIVLKVRNRSGTARRLSITGFFELVLGSNRAANLPHVVTELDSKTGALFARNAYNSEFAARVAFLDCSDDRRTVTGDRLEILGRNGTTSRPACMTRARLSGRTGAGLDPCLAMRTMIELADGEEREIAFTLGSGRDLADARHLVSRFRGTGPARTALEGVWAYWNRTLGAVNVQTPDPAVNFLANGWLLYQVLACRLWARSGFYQSGGAYGFRDQLQDALALVHAEPALLREQIVRAAGRQFPQGDAQHWWHPPLGRGVRTHISDDYLWLPYATCRYVTALGDIGVLDEKVPFLEGREVKAEEDSYYDLPARSDESASVYDHCVRAIKHGLRFGVHGLPLMGSGDWNDGMNLVGEHGKGESVWLAFFLYDVLVQFTVLARRRGDAAFADTCTTEAARLRASIEEHAWDGGWYRRAYFDDGTLLGSATSPECQIDSLPQSWSVLSHAGTPARTKLALAALDERLIDRELRVVRLFDPPFDTSELKPGYIKGYVPGVRENGGQYTHAAVWAAMAFAAAGEYARAWEVFDLINPMHHGKSAAAIATYKVEPYVIAADVYTNPQHAGRGGWTWYTGSAGWMYQLLTESLLGIRLEVDQLRIEPRIPASWPSLDVHYRHRETVYHVHVTNLGGTVSRVVCDGKEQANKLIPLRDDRQDHRVEIELGGS